MRRWSQAHIERHITGTDTVRDIVIGMADGLTVPFALPEAEAAEVAEVLTTYGMTADGTTPVVAALRQRPGAWVDFVMRFELGLEMPDPKRALRSAVTIAGAYIAGGFIPLGSYILWPKASMALVASVAITLLALAVFGYVKGQFTGAPPIRSAIQTVLIGGVAAGAAFLIARAIS